MPTKFHFWIICKYSLFWRKDPWCEACLKLYKSLPQRHLQA